MVSTQKISQSRRNYAWLGWCFWLLLAGLGVNLRVHAAADTAKASSQSSKAGETTQLVVSPDWTLKNLAGQSVTLSTFKGQPVLLVFWATWCPYCKKLLPGIERLHQKYQASGLKILAINIKEDWKPAVYWRNHEYSFDALLDGDAVASRYGVTGTPSLVFIDPDGRILSVKSFSDPNHPALEAFASHFAQPKNQLPSQPVKQ